MEELGCFFRVYLLTLPDPIPLPPGSTWTRVLRDLNVPELAGRQWTPAPQLSPRTNEGHNFVSLKFWQVPIEATSDMRPAMKVMDKIVNPGRGQIARAEPSPGNSHVTVVEAVTCVRPSSWEADGDDLTRCIDELLAYHRAYRLARNVLVPELTYERIHPLVPRLERNLDEPGPPQPMGISFLAHANMPEVPPEPLAGDALERVDQLIIRSGLQDPFVRYIERRLDAVVEMSVAGRPDQSVVQTAIAAEVLLDAILGLMMWEEGAATDDAAAVFGASPIARVQNEYHVRLGGQWSLTGQKMSPWHTSVAGVRNRVVHAGYRPTHAEARAALDALRDLELFIAERLAEKFTSHPKCAWLFLGSVGLKEHRRLSAGLKWAERVGEPMEDAIPRWLTAYRRWREEVDSQVLRRERARAR